METDYYLVYLQTYASTVIIGDSGDVQAIAAMAMGQHARVKDWPPMARYDFEVTLTNMMMRDRPKPAE